MDSHISPVRQSQTLSRREFLGVAASAGAVGAGVLLLGACGSGGSKASPTSTPGAVVDPPPETTTIRLGKTAIGVCSAPFQLAELFLPEEGFTTVQYIDDPVGHQNAKNEIDIHFVGGEQMTAMLDTSDQLVVLAGVHQTCWELFGNDRVQSLRDLKGKRIWIEKRDATDPSYLFMASLLAFVGIDINNEVEFVELSPNDFVQAFLAGTIDVFLLPPPVSMLFRSQNIGHVVLDTMMDPPWTQYFCCMAAGNRDFVEKHPAATKRALRAILKATDLCAKEPERAARYLVDKGYESNYDSTLDTFAGLSYTAWREFNPEDTVRFYALRLKEAGLLKSTPDELIARATDWRYLEQIKRELAVA